MLSCMLLCCMTTAKDWHLWLLESKNIKSKNIVQIYLEVKKKIGSRDFLSKSNEIRVIFCTHFQLRILLVTTPNKYLCMEDVASLWHTLVKFFKKYFTWPWRTNNKYFRRQNNSRKKYFKLIRPFLKNL